MLWSDLGAGRRRPCKGWGGRPVSWAGVIAVEACDLVRVLNSSPLRHGDSSLQRLLGCLQLESVCRLLCPVLGLACKGSACMSHSLWITAGHSRAYLPSKVKQEGSPQMHWTRHDMEKYI